MAKTKKSESAGAAGLIAAAQEAAGRGPPPVHLWNPPFCGDIDIRIARDGTWFHEGTPIGRPALVRLFAGILRREGDEHFLVTPVEKLRIRVDDLPFRAVDVERGPEGLVFTTDVGDRVPAGPGHEISVARDPETGAPAPMLHVRHGLMARIDRKTFYRLVDLGEVADGWFGLRSGGAFFPVAPAAELELGEDDA